MLDQVSNCSFLKSSVPRPVTYTGRGSENGESDIHKIGGTHGVPSFGGRKSYGIAARVRPSFDVIEGQAVSIQPWVEEAERALALGKFVVIKQRDNSRHDLYICGQLNTRGWTNRIFGRRGGKRLTAAEIVVPYVRSDLRLWE